MPEISVIVPTYNCLKFLPLAVGSILNQTYTEFELIIVDNGSDDGTGEWIGNLKDERIRYHYQKNTGCPAGSRNTGIELSKGEIIAFLDSDDIWEKQKLEKQRREPITFNQVIKYSTNVIRPYNSKTQRKDVCSLPAH